MHNGRVTQPVLDLFSEPRADHRSRIVARSTDRMAWLKARSSGVTATDVARLSSERALHAVAMDKVLGSSFTGNAYTEHGLAREPEIARWVKSVYGIDPSLDLYRAENNPLHLATPDGIRLWDGRLDQLLRARLLQQIFRLLPDGRFVLRARGDDQVGRLELAEIKTTVKPWRSIPRSYLRQVWWQQYVLGAERTLVVWEQHRDFVPVEAEPRCRWVDRDDNEIHQLVTLADRLLELMRR